MIISCYNCGLNLNGYCTVYDRRIPREKEIEPHECKFWKISRDNGLDIVKKLMTHKEDVHLWMCLADMIEGKTPPQGEQAAAWRLLWTASYIDDVTRVAIAKDIPPF